MRDDDREGFEEPRRAGRARGARRGAEPTRRKSRGGAVATSLAPRPAPPDGARGRERGTEPTRVRERRQSDGATPVLGNRDEEREEERPKPRRSLLRSRRRARLPFPARVASFALLGLRRPPPPFLCFQPHSVQEAPKTSSAHFLTASTPSGASCSAHRARGVRGGGGEGAPSRVVRRAPRLSLPSARRARGAATRSSVTRCAGRSAPPRLRHEPSERLLVQTRHGAFGTKRRLHRAAVAKAERRGRPGIRRGHAPDSAPRQRRRQHLEPVLRVRTKDAEATAPVINPPRLRRPNAPPPSSKPPSSSSSSSSRYASSSRRGRGWPREFARGASVRPRGDAFFFALKSVRLGVRVEVPARARRDAQPRSEPLPLARGPSPARTDAEPRP